MSSDLELRTGPLFVCGAPRTGTSAMFSALGKHRAFANPAFKDKEMRHFEKMLGDRFWQPELYVNKPSTLPLDEYVVEAVVTAIDQTYRRFLSGSTRRRYLCANPHDIFCLPFIAPVVRDSVFVVMARNPVENVWSMLSHPAGLWSPRSSLDGAPFHADDIAECCSHWNKVASATARALQPSTREQVMVIKHEDLASDPRTQLQTLFEFARLNHQEDIAEFLERNIVHSSFLADRDAEVSPTTRRSYFEDTHRTSRADEAFVATVNDLTRVGVEQLGEAGIVFQDPV